jgi:uncharacterized Tic20 family protein
VGNFSLQPLCYLRIHTFSLLADIFRLWDRENNLSIFIMQMGYELRNHRRDYGHTFSLILSLSPLINIFLLTIPFGNVLFPLIFWLIWRDRFSLVDQVGKNVLNAQISWSIWISISHLFFGMLCFIFIGFLFIWIVPLLWAIYTIVYAVRVSNEKPNHQIPLTIRFLK